VDLQKYGTEFGRHLILPGSQKASVNNEIFVEHIKTVFLSEIAKRRSERESEQRESGLLMDNCPSHVASDVMDMVTV
jgi:hypothetical protein